MSIDAHVRLSLGGAQPNGLLLYPDGTVMADMTHVGPNNEPPTTR